jgi:hypothetical protein
VGYTRFFPLVDISASLVVVSSGVIVVVVTRQNLVIVSVGILNRLGEVLVSLMEWFAPYDELAISISLSIGFLASSKIVYVHRLGEAIAGQGSTRRSVHPVWIRRRPWLAGVCSTC